MPKHLDITVIYCGLAVWGAFNSGNKGSHRINYGMSFSGINYLKPLKDNKGEIQNTLSLNKSCFFR